jgi:coenzyme F420-reducing hydrogenase beta subunit
MQEKLKDEAKALLEQDKVDYVIGYEQGSRRFDTTPLIARDKNDLERLVINPFIVNNLSKYLLELKGRAAIVSKGCDSRSIVSLIQDNKVSRDKVVIIGVPCSGTIQLDKIERLTGKDRDELDDVVRKGDRVIIGAHGKTSEFPIGEVLFDNCLGCEFPTPQDYDILLGKPTAPLAQGVASQKIRELKGMSHQQRWEFWKKEFHRCIRCYACRNVCPSCFCIRCFVEESEPQWLIPVPQWQESLMFQAMRSIHLAGRCTDCGGCERSCPMNIPLRSLTRAMYDLTNELFHYKAGMDKDAPALMTHYEKEEIEGLFR